MFGLSYEMWFVDPVSGAGKMFGVLKEKEADKRYIEKILKITQSLKSIMGMVEILRGKIQ